MAQSASDFTRAYSKFLARTWTDPEFKQAVQTNPAKALESAGVHLKAGATVTIKAPSGKPFLAEQIDKWMAGNESGHYDIVLPPSPPATVTAKTLDAAKLGNSSYCCCCCPSCSCT